MVSPFASPPLGRLLETAFSNLAPPELRQATVVQVRELLEALQRQGPRFIEKCLADADLLSEYDGDTIARQLTAECDFHLSPAGTGSITVGNRPADKRFALFFQDGVSTGIEKVCIPWVAAPGTPSDLDALPTEINVLLVNLHSPSYPLVTSPTAIATLGGYLKQRFGRMVHVEYLDMQREPSGSLRDHARRFAPDIVGLSVQIGAVGSMFAALDQLRSIGERPPLLVVGNVVPTHASDLIHHAVSDVIAVLGKGEDALAELVLGAARRSGAAGLFHVPDCSFRSGSVIYQVGSAVGHPPLTAPPDWAAIFAKYPPDGYQEIWVEASRGCPRKRYGRGCTFCSLTPNHGSCDWAPLPLDRVIEDLRTLAGYKVSHIRFADDEFMAGQALDSLALAQRFGGLKQALESTGGRMPTFDFAIRVDDVCRPGSGEDVPRHDVAGGSASNNELRSRALAAFRDAGLLQVYLGLESGSSRQLRRLAKGVTPDDNRRAIEVLRGLGIRIAAGWILIDPLMVDAAEFRENIEFLEVTGLARFGPDDDFVTNPINRLRVVEGSPMVSSLRKEGLLGERHSNLIEHEFSYKDARFALVGKALAGWEAAIQPLMYALKSKVGAEVLRKAVGSADLAAYLRRLKRLDFALAKALLHHLEVPAPIVGPAADLGELLGVFRRERQEVLESLFQDIQHGIADDSSGTLRLGFEQMGLTPGQGREPGDGRAEGAPAVESAGNRSQKRGKAMTRIVITGGAGFVGSNLARHLTNAGFEVVAIDDLSFGRAENLPPDVPLLVGDVARSETWKELHGFSAVVHLAGASSACMFDDDLVGSFQKNISGLLQVLQAAHRVGCQRVVYASTSVVYGNCPGLLCEEGPVDVINMYAASKWCMERIAQVFQRQHMAIDTVGLRFMSVYGPREDHKGSYANLVSQFIWDLEADRRPIIYGDGSQTRDFVCVWDVAEAIRLTLACANRLGNAVFNVGTGVPTSLNELVACLGEITGTQIRPHFVANPFGALYNKHQNAKIKAAATRLAFSPRVTLREGIREILDCRGWQGDRDGVRTPPRGRSTLPSAAHDTAAKPRTEGAPQDD